MTKKHFTLIAGALNVRAKGIYYSGANTETKIYAMVELRNLMYQFADEFELLNERFNKAKFFSACNIQETLEKLDSEISV